MDASFLTCYVAEPACAFRSRHGPYLHQSLGACERNQKGIALVQVTARACMTAGGPSSI